MSERFCSIILAIGSSANPVFVDSLSVGLSKLYGTAPLNTTLRLAHLLAQMAVETKWFTELDENLNYRAERLVQVWPKRFPTIALALPFARNPKALANRVYNGRMGNRLDSDDGWFFRGCGGLHHTGRDEHSVRAAAIGVSIIDFGTLMRDYSQGEIILKASISYCDDRRVWDDMDRNSLEDVTKLINGGHNGLKDRALALSRARSAIQRYL